MRLNHILIFCHDICISYTNMIFSTSCTCKKHHVKINPLHWMLGCNRNRLTLWQWSSLDSHADCRLARCHRKSNRNDDSEQWVKYVFIIRRIFVHIVHTIYFWYLAITDLCRWCRRDILNRSVLVWKNK